jgi:pimeloyl-ACP methyl ester carboxylesterase
VIAASVHATCDKDRFNRSHDLSNETKEQEETIMSTRSDIAIVLVHGAFVDGSGWRGVYDQLKGEGYDVAVVQNPTLSLEGDVAATRQVIDARDKRVVLVGHSYGGAVITEAGTHPKVEALVYVAAYAPDKGESVGALLATAPADAPAPPILPPQDGFLFLDRDKFPAAFAADANPEQAAFMADSQVGCHVNAVSGSVTEPAWRVKPSWYLVTTEDHMIPPASQREMAQRAGATVVEVAGPHAIFVSQPGAVASFIAQAAETLAPSS